MYKRMNSVSVFRISQSKERDQQLTGQSQQSEALMPNLVKGDEGKMGEG